MPSHRPPIHRRDFLHMLLRTSPVVLTSSYLLDGVPQPEPRIIFVDYGHMHRPTQDDDAPVLGQFYVARRGDVWVASAAHQPGTFTPVYRTAYVA